MAAPDSRDFKIRLAAFQFLKEQTSFYQGGNLPRELLTEGFPWEGSLVTLMGPSGIWKPRQLADMPISITTVPPKPSGRPAPYEDWIDEFGILHYRYMGENPRHHHNVWLRKAMATRTPLIYFKGVAVNWYLPIWPVPIIADDPDSLTCEVDLRAAGEGIAQEVQYGDMPAKEYATVTINRRVHQRAFHRMVLAAYHSRCGVCRLRHDPLLDASHILPDSHPRGEPIVPNGIALCKLHHAAYDANIIGVSPDLEIQIRRDVLEEKDGPMLVHGLQGFQGGSLSVPRRADLRPNRDFLAERYELFQRAG